MVKDLMTPLCETGGGGVHSRKRDLELVALAATTLGLDDGASSSSCVRTLSLYGPGRMLSALTLHW